MVPLMKTNFLGSSGQNTFKVTPGAAGRHRASPRRTRRPPTVEDGAARHRRRRDRADLDRLAAAASPRPSAAAAVRRSPTRSPPTTAPTTRPSRPRSRTELDEPRRTPARSRSPPRAASAAPATSRSTSPRRTRPTCSRRPTTILDRRLDELDSHRRRLSSNLAASRPYIAVDGRPRRCRGSRASARSPSAALVSQAMQPSTIGSIVIDETTLTIYLAVGRPAHDHRGARGPRRSPRVTGPVAPRHPRDRRAESTARRRSPPSRASARATVTATPNSDDLGTASGRGHHGARRRPTCPPARRRRSAASSADQSDAFTQLGLALLVADPDRLHRDGRDLQVAAAAAAAARLGAVRGDRRDRAAGHHRHPARRRIADRCAHAHRHRGDERDRARRPGQPVPRRGHEGARRPRARCVAASAPDPHDGARDDLRAACRWRSASPATAASSRSRSRSS